MPVAAPKTTHQPLLRDRAADTPVDCVLLVRDLDRRQKRDGSPFLRLTLADRSGTVPGVLCRAEDDDEPAVEPGTPIHLTGRLTEHPRYGRQIVVSGLAEPDPQDIDWTRLVDGPARPTVELLEDLETLLGSISDPRLARLMHRLLGVDTPLGIAYRHAPAAKYNHHAYPHGLLVYSVQVAHVVSAGAAVFPRASTATWPSAGRSFTTPCSRSSPGSWVPALTPCGMPVGPWGTPCRLTRPPLGRCSPVRRAPTRPTRQPRPLRARKPRKTHGTRSTRCSPAAGLEQPASAGGPSSRLIAHETQPTPHPPPLRTRGERHSARRCAGARSRARGRPRAAIHAAPVARVSGSPAPQRRT